MPVRITRGQSFRQKSKFALVAVANIAVAKQINFEEYVGGMIFIPSGSSITTLTFYCAPYADDSQSVAGAVQDVPAPTFYQLYYGPTATSPNTAISMSVTAGKSYNLPADLFGAGGVIIIADAAGAVELSLKG